MPRAAAMTSAMLIPTFGAGRYTQFPSGEWTPGSIPWESIAPTPCRVFPANERDIQAKWGEGLKVDCVAWILPDVILPPEVLTATNGAQTPIKIDGVTYMVVKVRDLAKFGKLKEVYLRRFTRG